VLTTRGVIYIHSAPPAMCPHLEWAIGGALGDRVSLEWTPQPAAPSVMRTELPWVGEPGTASAIASALREFPRLRFEVTEDPSPGNEGERYACTPTLGVFRATVGVHGDILVPEDRLRTAVDVAIAEDLPITEVIGDLLGQPWDDELEPFRYAGEGAPVRWLHRVG
jgi:Protein of unknown function (DUF3145)